ncbi:MAG: hypothetical protein NTZ44_02555 [Candidatus Nomurabacteria bacterium]|nr:hypothetical protein [Candidatus Nomurabacteria bacterium]
MIYNIHPIFVHFPIALLFLYSFVKILPFKRWLPGVAWNHIERALLFFGVLGAFTALGTGEIAEKLYQSEHKLIEIHSTFAGIATWIYVALLFGEIISVLNNSYQNLIQEIKIDKIKTFLVKLENILCSGTFSKILSILGLIAISVTGILGGAIVYGASADPFAGFILKLFGINL